MCITARHAWQRYGKFQSGSPGCHLSRFPGINETPSGLKSKDKMLGFQDLFSEKYDPDKKQIDCKLDCRVRLDFRPGLFHLSAPVNVIKNKQRISSQMFQNFLKILQGR